MGYLICEKCGGYYKLQNGEAPDNFDFCQCDGTLKHVVFGASKIYDFWGVKNRRFLTACKNL